MNIFKRLTNLSIKQKRSVSYHQASKFRLNDKNGSLITLLFPSYILNTQETQELHALLQKIEHRCKFSSSKITFDYDTLTIEEYNKLELLFSKINDNNGEIHINISDNYVFKIVTIATCCFIGGVALLH